MTKTLYDKVKEMSQKIERLEFDNEALEMAHNEGKEINAELVSKTDELENRLEVSEKAHYKTLEQLRIATKQLRITTKALEYYAQCKHLNLDILTMLLDKHKNEFADFEVYEDGETARRAIKEMEGVK